MLDIVELNDSLKLRAIGRLLISEHPFIKLVRAKIDYKSFFSPSIAFKMDSVSLRGIEILKNDRNKAWSNRALDTDRRLIAAIRETSLKEVVTSRGQGSIPFFTIWTRGARKVRGLS